MATERHLPCSQARLLNQVAADCALAERLPVPSRPPASRARVALVTGATGFLGKYLVRELLRSTELRLACLVRGSTPRAAYQRLAGALAEVGVDVERLTERIEVVCGDTGDPRLGLDPDTYRQLSARVERVYHVAALVNWGRPYPRLRKPNVLGTFHVLRFALFGRPKPLLFVSSMAVCFAHEGPDWVDEDTPMLPHVPALALGYAQSKCVAEVLVRGAAARGLPATILRPALISGDTSSGRGNDQDLIAALVRGCVASGMAIDVEWLLDCVPVDFVAQVAAQMPVDEPGCETLHLVHDRPRHWREFILWLHLKGFPQRFVSSSTWLASFDDGPIRKTPLRAYRSFFRGAPDSPEARRPFEAFLAPRQRQVCSQRSLHRLRELGLRAPALDDALLGKYLRAYALGPPRAVAYRRQPRAAETPPEQILESLWPKRVRAGDVQELPLCTGDGILSEIARFGVGKSAGLKRVRFTSGGAGSEAPQQDVVLKAKAPDAHMIDLVAEVATLCSPAVGRAFREAPEILGFPGSQQRELQAYQQGPPLAAFQPRYYGSHFEPESGLLTLVLEHVVDGRSNGPGTQASWSATDIASVVEQLGELHAVARGVIDRCDLRREQVRFEAMWRRRPLWQALYAHARGPLRRWGGEAFDARYRQAILAPERWLEGLCSQPVTWTHNDFNPRNLLLRAGDRPRTLCVFDWELATHGAPQRDLTEFLCFAGLGGRPLAHWVEIHRQKLSAGSGLVLDPDLWWKGVACALDLFLVERISMYVMFHHYRPQPFLPALVDNWIRLRIATESGGASATPIHGPRAPLDPAPQRSP